MIVLKRFGLHPLPGVRLTLVSRVRETPYSGMLPGLIAGHYSKDEAHIDLEPLARFAGARAVFDEAVGLDVDRQASAVRRPATDSLRRLVDRHRIDAESRGPWRRRAHGACEADRSPARSLVGVDDPAVRERHRQENCRCWRWCRRRRVAAGGAARDANTADRPGRQRYASRVSPLHGRSIVAHAQPISAPEIRADSRRASGRRSSRQRRGDSEGV